MKVVLNLNIKITPMNISNDKSMFSKSSKMKKFFIIFFVVLASVSEGQNPQWIVYTRQNSSLPGNTVGDVAIDKNNVKWIATNNGVAKLNGSVWTIYDSNNTNISNDVNCVAIDKLNNIWIGTSYHGIAKFENAIWTVYDTINSDLPSNRVYSIEIDNNNNKWLGTFGKGIVKFDDINWINYNTSNSGMSSNFILSLSLEEHIKWIGAFDFNGGLAKFNDTSWIIYNTSNSGLPSNVIRDIFIDNEKNKWIATEFGGLAKFNSSQNIWTIYNRVNSGIPSNNLTTIFVTNTIKWIGTLGAGLAKFNDSNWTVYNPGNSPIPGISIYSISMDSLGNIWIGTDEGLAVHNPNGIVSVMNNQMIIPKSFTLYQNFPNPFNPTTTIMFEITKQTFVTIKIFDIRGKRIETIISKNISPGLYSEVFDGSKLESGIYFYRLEANGFSETKRMILLK